MYFVRCNSGIYDRCRKDDITVLQKITLRTVYHLFSEHNTTMPIINCITKFYSNFKLSFFPPLSPSIIITNLPQNISFGFW